MTVTRHEVAQAAGVSLRTVSNVVNGYVHVAPATRARVLQAIQELEYRPSELARNLRRGRSGLIGLGLPELDTPYFAELTRAVVTEGRQRGYTVVIDQTDGQQSREQALIERTTSGSLFDALILNPLSLTAADLERIDPARPLVFLGEMASPGFSHVVIDNRAAAFDAVTHLASLGRRHIAAIGAEETVRATSSSRLQGYYDALDAAGLDRDPALVASVAAFRRPEGAAAMAHLLDGPTRPDAVFCFCDPLALGALRTLLTRGLRVPDDIAVIDFDDVEDGAFATPSLSSIAPDKAFIAGAALDLVMAKLADDGTGGDQQPVAPHRLVIRESTASVGQL